MTANISERTGNTTVSDPLLACEAAAVTCVLDPPCGIADTILFYDKGCPYSGYPNCDECMATYLDKRMMEMLVTATYVWVM